ncbi:LLM class flavin-dependent oxidoreductase [Streptomyces sp. PanSC9]|uniref:LLM class flavin-dependent oxidoreductase n=1 Tax=Streptomyces sp. PanSC9 TaxID=1520461 RepID=UPI000F48E0FC|nr:LLM class flavin-dependent oxidoreductase [Streptomyces sp. PanSC9]ROP54168.1 alkanesulfonate monooxygenase SsuD/methylene tetrahydromethanopterin reductase-like flavin-dependent oxidoreductase (luciferase family) [Streptomyces sp. PanSC9]
MSSLLHLAAALDQPDVHDAGSYVELARLAERGGLDFVTLDDSPEPSGPDALAVLCRVAPATRRIGLVPTLTATPTAPYRVPAAVAVLDRVGRGRAGWRVDVSGCAEEARPSGGRAVTPDGTARFGPGEATGSAAGPWEGWWAGRDDGTAAGPWGGEVVRDPAGGPLPGHDRAHPAGSTATALQDRGPTSLPGPAPGDCVRVVDATDERTWNGAALHADVALVRAATPARAAAVRDGLRARAAVHGRRPDALRVLVSLLVDLGDGEYAAEPGHGGGGPRPTTRGPLYRGGPVDLAELVGSWHAAGVTDGFHLLPAEPRRDLERLVNGTVALLQHRGLFRTFYPGGTLREHLGLAAPAYRTGPWGTAEHR